MCVPLGVLTGLVCLAVIMTGCISNPSTPATEGPSPAPNGSALIPAGNRVTAAMTLESGAAQSPLLPAKASSILIPPPGEIPAGAVVAFTAASLKGASGKIGAEFENATPGAHVSFNLDGTQVLKHQVENGAYADVFISASTKYTSELQKGGYFINDTVRNLTSNYIIVIVPKTNPGKITSLANLSEPGKRIVIGTEDVPVGINTRQVISKLENSTFTPAWKTGLMGNIKSYETTEPGIVTKVSLGEADAGFIYESSYKSAKNGTLMAISIPEKDNALQVYTIGVLQKSTNKPAATAFENFMLSEKGQKILADFGFRSMNSGF